MSGFPGKPTATLPHQSETISKKLVYTTGTGIPGSYQCFLAFEDLCRKINRRGIFLCKNPMFRAHVARDYVEVVEFCDMDRLLAESDLIIHHGGIGTVADAINAAIPQIVIPRAFDQFDNANRVVALRIGTRMTEEAFRDVGGASMEVEGLLSRAAEIRAKIRSLDLASRHAENSLVTAMNEILKKMEFKRTSPPARRLQTANAIPEGCVL